MSRSQTWRSLFRALGSHWSFNGDRLLFRPRGTLPAPQWAQSHKYSPGACGTSFSRGRLGPEKRSKVLSCSFMWFLLHRKIGRKCCLPHSCGSFCFRKSDERFAFLIHVFLFVGKSIERLVFLIHVVLDTSENRSNILSSSFMLFFLSTSEKRSKVVSSSLWMFSFEGDFRII